MKYLNLFLAVILFVGCDKAYLDDHPQNFEHGRLLIEFQDSVKLQEAAGICFNFNTPVIWAKGFSFVSSLPADSADALRSVLISRAYIDQPSLNDAFIVSDPSRILLNGIRFNNLQQMDTSDLSAIEHSFQMKEYYYPGGSYPYCRSVLVQVPDSTEASFSYQFYMSKKVKNIRLYNEQMN